MASEKHDDAATAEQKRRNRIALTTLVVGKLLGILGIILAFTAHRTLGGVLLALAFTCVAVTIGMSLGTFRKRRDDELSEAAVLEKMVREGTLKDHLRDVEQKLRKEHEEQNREIDRNS